MCCVGGCGGVCMCWRMKKMGVDLKVVLPEHCKYMYSPSMCINVCVGVYMRVCMGEGVYIKQIICTCCGGDPPARVWTSQ